ncbi:MAG: nucleotide pyrophosphohydrolase [Muribaculaceae bacterium]|nr:nucleotide pyrophosphohydrolase [Muribaculaceae bacterium]
MNGITLSDLQSLVDTWITTTGGGYFSELTNTAVLTEEVGEVARIMARRYGDQVPKSTDMISDERLADELADVLWVLAALANQTGVNLSEALMRNLNKKNVRDSARFRQQ